MNRTEQFLYIPADKNAEKILLRLDQPQQLTNLDEITQLYTLYAKLATETNLKTALEEILAVACTFTNTDRGCIQLVSEDGKRLEIFAHRGYDDKTSSFINFFRFEGFDAGCDIVRAERRRLIIEEVIGFPGLEGTEAGKATLADGIRAAQSTPVISHKNETVGVLSTQFTHPYRPTEHQLKLVDLLAWAAADFVVRYYAEKGLRESEQRFRNLVESYAQAVWETNPEGEVVVDSPSWRAYTGQTMDEWTGYGWVDAIHPDDREYAERLWRKAVAAGESVNAEFRLRSASGGYRWTNLIATPIFDESNTISKWVGMNIDIHDRQMAEQALEDRNRELKESRDELEQERYFLEQVTDKTPLLIYVFDLQQQRFTYINKRVEELIGKSPEYFYAMGPHLFQSILHPDDVPVRAGYLGTLKRLMKGETRQMEFRIWTGREFRWFRSVDSIFQEDDGEIMQVIGIAEDVTYEKLVEDNDRFRSNPDRLN